VRANGFCAQETRNERPGRLSLLELCFFAELRLKIRIDLWLEKVKRFIIECDCNTTESIRLPFFRASSRIITDSWLTFKKILFFDEKSLASFFASK
jgi:hypothetical protein